MTTQRKWNTPTEDFSITAIATAEQLFRKVLVDIERDLWTGSHTAIDSMGFPCDIKNGRKFNIIGLMLHTFYNTIGINSSTAVFELLITIVGSEANSMQFTSPRTLEIAKGKRGVIDLVERCVRKCEWIRHEKMAKKRIEQEYNAEG